MAVVENSFFLFLIFLLSACFDTIQCQDDKNCPLYGCNLAGTFSYRANVPDSNMSVTWISPFVSDYIPSALGCVGNNINIICPSLNSLFSGYLSIRSQSGQAVWRDDILRSPTLPIMDVNGDIIGSDGYELIKYSVIGSANPQIHLNPPLYPIYSLTISDSGVILIVSKTGQVATYDTEGVHVASLWLNGTVERVNGTFIPMTQPVISRTRAYILTQFRPNNIQPPDLGLQRLYAIDILDDIVGRLEVAWAYNFERENYVPGSPHRHSDFRNPFLKNDKFVQTFEADFMSTVRKTPKTTLDSGSMRHRKSDPEPVRLIETKPLVMVNTDLNTVYINVPPPVPMLQRVSNLWALKDTGDNPGLMFKASLNISRMAMYQTGDTRQDKSETYVHNNKELLRQYANHPRWLNSPQKNNKKSTNQNKAGVYYVWAVGADSETVMKLSPLDGTILESVNVSALVKASAVVTSDVMVSRAYEEDDDVLIMGVSVPLVSRRNDFSKHNAVFSKQDNMTGYVIGVKENELLWMVPTPNNTEVRGQIIAVPAENEEDRLVVFSGNMESSFIFAIN